VAPCPGVGQRKRLGVTFAGARVKALAEHGTFANDTYTYHHEGLMTLMTKGTE
jgi:hypothetical protein